MSALSPVSSMASLSDALPLSVKINEEFFFEVVKTIQPIKWSTFEELLSFIPSLMASTKIPKRNFFADLIQICKATQNCEGYCEKKAGELFAKCLKALLEKGYKFEQISVSGSINHYSNFPMHCAIKENCPALCRALFIIDVKFLENRNFSKLTPLHYATKEGEKACMQTLIDLGANIFVHPETLSSPTTGAANGDCIKLLYQKALIARKTNLTDLRDHVVKAINEMCYAESYFGLDLDDSKKAQNWEKIAEKCQAMVDVLKAANERERKEKSAT